MYLFEQHAEVAPTIEIRPQGTPGKSTLTSRLAPSVQRKEVPQAPASEVEPYRGEDPFAIHLIGNVQCKGEADGDVHAAAARGVAGATSALPFAEQIQASFGPLFDVAGIQAHVGGPATEACADMGARAFATGHHVAFAGAPDLHTAAHEAAHVIQQRAGVSLKGGVGQAGDDHERHADAVADLVVRGESAASLLASYGGSGGGGGGAIQRVEEDEDKDPDFDGEGILAKPKTLYKSEDTSSAKVADLKKGDRVTVESRNPSKLGRSWVKVTASGKTGHINTKDAVPTVASGKNHDGNQGYLEEKKCWVKLHQGELIVLAEDHNKAPLLQLIRATGAKDFMYEGFTEHAEGAEYAAVNAAVDERAAKLQTKAGVEANQSDVEKQQGEAFWPKVVSGVHGIQITDTYVSGSDTASDHLRWAILVAAAQTTGNLHTAYTTHQALLDTTAEALKNSPVHAIGALKNQPARDALRTFIAAFLELGHTKLADAGSTLGDDSKEFFDKKWAPQTRMHDDQHRDAEKARDKSMAEHILRAQKGNYRLYSAGEFHIARLKPWLEEQGIKTMSMADYIEQHRSGVT